jgi:hypothetical protein
MIPYWFLFLVPAFAALSERPGGLLRGRFAFSWLLIWSLFAVVIGLRYQVGGDWYNYLRQFSFMQYMTLSQFLEYGIDPGYGLLNSFAAKLDWGVIGVNFISAALFSFGLLTFCRQQPRPWLALLVAIPYLVIVVGMGYTRQGIAIGLAMLGLVALARKSNIGFVFWIILAATFHKSAVVLLPIAILATTEKKIWTAVWVTVAFVATYILLLQDSVDRLITNYVDSELQSQGAIFRIAMNALPAIVFLALRDSFELEPVERRLWTWLCLFALGSVVLLIVSPSSTAVDRMALYFIPVQLFVLSRLPDALARKKISGSAAVFGIIVYSASVQFVWLNFATHAYAWVPYKFYPLEVL